MVERQSCLQLLRVFVEKFICLPHSCTFFNGSVPLYALQPTRATTLSQIAYDSPS